MFSWFRKSPTEPLAVAMSGVKLADRLLVVGCSDPLLIAALAAKTGLTGRACAVDRDEARAREAGRIAEIEGALVETAVWRGGRLPYPDDPFDVVVVRDPSSQAESDLSGSLHAVLDALRPGGRCVVIDGSRRRGLGGLRGGGGKRTPASDAITGAFRDAGFLAVRTLAEREGMVFVEGVKRNV
jgi:SAM-dependent methyltransferase